MSSPISFETYRVTKQWTVDDFKNRAHHLATNQIYVLSDAEKKSLLKVLSDHSFVPLSVPKFKETLKDVRNEQAARELTNMYLDYYMEYFQYKQLARQKIDELKKSIKMTTKKSTVKTTSGKTTAGKKVSKKTKRSKSKTKTKTK
jgi:hypothetical protein